MKTLDWLERSATWFGSLGAAMLGCLLFHGCLMPNPHPPTPTPDPPKPAVTVSGVKTDGKGHVTFSVAVDLQTPGPTPPVPPVPPVPPAPVQGASVVILYDSAKITAMPKEQQNILFEDDVWKYITAHWPLGPDGKTRECRIWDASIDVSGDPSVACKAAHARPHASLPWIVVSNGKTGYEGPLPANVADAMTLLKKYGE